MTLVVMLLYLAKAMMVLFLLWASSASAVVLDWSAVTWTPGSLSQSFDLDADGQNDVTVAFSGNTSALQGGSPAISTAFQGGQITAPSTLAANVDFASTSGALTVTVTFTGFLAADVSFSLYDVDADRKGSSSNFAYQDQVLNLSGNGEKGVVIPSVTTGSLVSYSGGLAQGQDVSPNSGAGSGAGNVGINYTGPVHSIQFTYGSANNIAGNNPDPQEFAISSITFRKVPEVGVVPLAIFLCCFTMLMARRTLG